MQVCPGAFHCSNGSHGYSAIPPALHYLPVYAALISSSLSLMGAALNMIAYCAFKDLRKGTAQTIIAVLAMADFLLALSIIAGASILLAYGITSDRHLFSNKECYNFDTLCQIQAFVALSAFGSSFIWTSVLAVHFFLVTVCTRSTWPHKLMPLYNIVSWLVPLSFTLPSLLLGKLGYNHAFSWTCFVRATKRPKDHELLLQWDILEVASAVCILLGYIFVLFGVSLKSVSLRCTFVQFITYAKQYHRLTYVRLHGYSRPVHTPNTQGCSKLKRSSPATAACLNIVDNCTDTQPLWKIVQHSYSYMVLTALPDFCTFAVTESVCTCT